jgi:hypothetical protein
MSDLRTFDSDDKSEMSQRLDEFVARCELVISTVFQRNYNDRQIFAEWLRGLIAESENPFWILHDHPLYIIAEYLGIDTASVETGQFGAEYIRLAQRQNW